MWDCLVIGGGPVGVSAALAARAEGLEVALVYKQPDELQAFPLPETYYGLTQTTGQELFEFGLSQAQSAGVALFQDEITGLSLCTNGYTALGGSTYETQGLILANGEPKSQGVSWLTGDVVGLVGRQAEKQGALYRNRMVGVVGAGAYAVAQANLLAAVAKSVTLFTDGNRLSADPGDLSINEYPIAQLLENGRITGIGFANGISLNIDGVFVANRVAGVEDLLAGLVGNKPVSLQPDGSTDLPGVFAVTHPSSASIPLPEKIVLGYRMGKAYAVWKRGSIL